MNKRTLGKTGFSVGEIGLGCWQLGADWGNGITKDTAFSILQEAVDNGVNFLIPPMYMEKEKAKNS